MNGLSRSALAPLLVFLAGLGVCSSLLLNHLGQSHITQWDELVHLNVVHNLSDHCCVPELHVADLGTDEEDSGDAAFQKGGIVWNNNHIWLHKPMLPFYLRAALFRCFGETLFLFRLPSAVFDVLAAICLFLIGKQFSGPWTGAAAGLLFVSNRFVFELVQGRQFSDLSDVMTILFLTMLLGLTLAVAAGRPLFFSDRQSPGAYLASANAAGLISALGYSCKGGLILPGVGVFALALLLQCGWRRGASYAALMLLVMSAMVFPGYSYFSRHFPRQFYYEQGLQLAHLFRDVEGWGRPWHYYITVYWQEVLGVRLGCLAFAAMAAVLLPRWRNRRNLLLLIWILVWVVPLTFGVSKIANFILPVLPAAVLLVGFAAGDLLPSRQHPSPWPAAIGCMVFLAAPLTDAYSSHKALTALGLFLLTLALLFAPRRAFRNASPAVSRPLLIALVGLMCATLVVRVSRENWKMSQSMPSDNEDQTALRVTANLTQGRLPQGAVVLVQQGPGEEGRNLHLCFQYWSGLDSIPARQLDFAKRTLAAAHPLYLVTKKSRADATLVEKVPYGYLYRIR